METFLLWLLGAFGAFLAFPNVFVFLLWTAFVFAGAIWWYREQIKNRPEWILGKIAEGKVARDRARALARAAGDEAEQLAVKLGLKDAPQEPK